MSDLNDRIEHWRAVSGKPEIANKLLIECQERIEELEHDRRSLENTNAGLMIQIQEHRHTAESRLKVAVAKLDEPEDSYYALSATASELHRKGESLCCQNGNLLVANHDLESRLKIALMHLKIADEAMLACKGTCYEDVEAALDKIKEKS